MQSQGLEGLVLNMETCSPQLVQSLGAFNVPCTLYFSAGVEIERQIGTCIARHAMMPARLLHIFVLQSVVLTSCKCSESEQEPAGASDSDIPGLAAAVLWPVCGYRDQCELTHLLHLGAPSPRAMVEMLQHLVTLTAGVRFLQRFFCLNARLRLVHLCGCAFL
jgi:hypothetical protein